MANRRSSAPIRYAVVGLGHIAQAAILPAFRNATRNSQLVALFSGDEIKRQKLGKRYRLPAMPYEEYDEYLQSGQVDAVFIALPNSMHAEYTVRAAERGVHVLCEKPMAVTVDDCQRMKQACADHDVKLMIAYRLHFEEANLQAIEIVQSGEIGLPRFFTSSFGFQVDDPNIRIEKELGGGVLFDIGIYCINAARYLFRTEPREVFASETHNDEPRFEEIAETWAITMRFPEERLASFTASFGVAPVSTYSVVGTEGMLTLNPAYDWTTPLRYDLTKNGKTKRRTFVRRDHFAPEIMHFSQSILDDRDPEPGGEEGLADVRIIEALHESARRNAPVQLDPYEVPRRPTPDLEMHAPASFQPHLVNVDDPQLD